MKEILLGMDGMTLDDLVSIARDGAQVRLTRESEERIRNTWNLVQKWLKEEKIIYGITTGFGALSDVIISREDTRRLQENILMSHAAGVGNFLDEETVRGIMALRIKDLARGHAAIRLETVQRLMELLNRKVYPLVPEKGSVGASGDLAPLAHLALVLMGQGEAFQEGRRIPGAEALRQCGLTPWQLEAGEGLSLVNGTQMTNAIGALALYDALQLSKMADIAAAMSLEVLMGSRMEFDPRIHAVRPHPGQAASADNMRRMTQNSEIVSSHRDCSRIQDAYTLRCSPQVHGATKDALHYAKRVVETEINSSTNNPLIFHETEEFLLGGNFHGQPLALAMDFLCMAISELANISERRIERLVNPKLSGLPAFLVKDGGLNSGFMIAQYTAASLVSENKILSHPACVDSIPTSANKEDHVPMAPISARKFREITRNAYYVIAIEFLCGAQGMDLFTNLKAGNGSRVAYQMIRDAVPHLENDRILSKDIETMVKLMYSGKILSQVQKNIGKLL
ncbi:histidine ammonia-lyase [Desulforhabdus amnigena]|jgi:histidine ammonia-lyase|uniref:Histidine ammonia-lyase n=1 Tax=Desulforhabdus amnigena TaxID=40218 RepID=A0A9W6FVK4_9BACT|nr:histidine ammonia-lyase [Desulforhabdus amnigena]NLJ28908.1 histidine ammonia-lyase [Deltaproteobacteria bacterium]GLI35643.1 histidine ammonia-lyase [Desulforhabdus amnigena]